MSFIVDKEELKPGLIIFRRGDVAHRNFYCRVKLPKEDRYKTFSLKTPEIVTARQMAYRKEVDIEFRIEHDVAVFNRPFRQVAEEYLATQERRVAAGEISADRTKNLKSAFGRALDAYVGSVQIHLIGQDRWAQYPTWRRENGKGRFSARISDATIGFEMGALNAVMNYAISRRYVPASHRFEGRPKLKTMRRDEIHAGGISQAAQLRAWLGRSGDDAAGPLVSKDLLQFHSDHVQHRHASRRGEKPALARHHGRQGS
jgi:hypothetical protein